VVYTHWNPDCFGKLWANASQDGLASQTGQRHVLLCTAIAVKQAERRQEMTSCSEHEARQNLVKATFPDIEFTKEEADTLGFFLLEINIRETKLKQLGQDLRICGETLRYAARNCARNPKEREAIKRISEFAKVSIT
jgi:hypothetical protein